jgi:hypothetical protein
MTTNEEFRNFYTLHYISGCHRIKKNEVSGTCRTHGTKGQLGTEILVGNATERDIWGNEPKTAR